MTKTKRNITIYSGVILLFGLILMITLIIIYDSIDVKSNFTDETLTIGSYVVTDYEKKQNQVSFRVPNASDFVERHIVNHINYVDHLTDDFKGMDYYVFLKENQFFTLSYDQIQDKFELYSGVLRVTYDNQTYAIPYIEASSSEVSVDVFKNYEDLKDYYTYLEQTIFNDDLNIVRLKGYLIDEDNQIINPLETVDIILEYIDDEVIIKIV